MEPVKSFRAAGSIAAYRVVAADAPASGQPSAKQFDTVSANILGLAVDDATTGGAVAVATGNGEIASAVCGASVSAGSIVGPDTSGSIVERTNPATTTTAFVKTVGIALASGSTNSVIPVLIQISNKAQG